MTKVLVIADTHNKLPPIICELARGADEIWHLGDVCDDWIVDELRALGPPLTLVRGNCDSNYQWPLVCDLTRNGIRFRLQHIAPSPSQATRLRHSAPWPYPCAARRDDWRRSLFKPRLCHAPQSRSTAERRLARPQ